MLLNKRLREARSIAEELGVENVTFEQRKGTHFMLHGTYQGREVKALIARQASHNWRTVQYFKSNLRQAIRGAAQ